MGVPDSTIYYMNWAKRETQTVFLIHEWLALSDAAKLFFAKDKSIRIGKLGSIHISNTTIKFAESIFLPKGNYIVRAFRMDADGPTDCVNQEYIHSESDNERRTISNSNKQYLKYVVSHAEYLKTVREWAIEDGQFYETFGTLI